MALRTIFRKLSQKNELEKITAGVNKIGKAIVNKPLTDAIHKYDKNITTTTARNALLELVTQHVKKGAITAPVVKEILNALDKIIPALLEGSSAQSVLMSDIRKHIISEYGEGSTAAKASYKMMRVDQDKWQAENKAYSAVVEMKNKDKRQIEFTDVYDAMDKAAASDKWSDQAVAVELATGARIGEVLLISTFEALPKQPGYIRQRHLSKQKDNADKREYIDKPVLHLSVGQVLELVAKIRHSLRKEIDEVERGEKKAYDVSQSKNATVNRSIDRLIPDIDPVTKKNLNTSHTLRKMYANLAYALLADKSKWSEQSFYSHVLGHSNLSTAKSYSTIQVDVPKIKHERVSTEIADVKADTNINKVDINELSKQMQALQVQINRAIKEEKRAPVITMISDVPRNEIKRDGNGYDRLLETVQVMKSKGIDINRQNIRSLGYGSALVTRYFADNGIKSKLGRKPKA